MTTETITWIPVSQRLPDTTRPVIAAVPLSDGSFDPWPARYVPLHGGFVNMEDDDDVMDRVTHWAEMPKGPKA